jgi:hypothetical protein
MDYDESEIELVLPMSMQVNSTLYQPGSIEVS